MARNNILDGFSLVDQIFKTFEDATNYATSGGYPPYNMVQFNGEDKFQITVAVAGFEKDDLKVTQVDNHLVIKGKSTPSYKEKDVSYIHQGLANRSFELKFPMKESVKVDGVRHKNGLLTVDLYVEEPESSVRSFDID